MTSTLHMIVTASFRRSFLMILAISLFVQPGAADAAPVELRDGDRVVFLGSGLLERAQRYGFFETEMTRRWPERSILFRNLAWSGDTVFGDSWVYSLSHPNHEVRRDQVFQVVAEQRPTVIIIGYGAIEAFAGPAELDRWQSGLMRVVTRLRDTGARLMLMSSPPQEDNGAPGTDAYNLHLAEYMEIMRKVAAAEAIPLIDLDQRVREFRAQNPTTTLTVNGLHFSEEGYRTLSRLFSRAMGWDEPSWLTSVDAQTLQVSSTTATQGEVVRDGDRLTFEVTDRWLPQPLSTDHVPVSAPGRTLKVDQLSPGNYTLYTGGVEVLTTNDRELAAGVPLLRGPAFERAEQLRQAIMEKNRLFFTRWRPENEVYLRGFRQREQGRNTIELPLFDPLIQQQEQRIARLRRPETDYYHLIPAAPASRRGPAIVPDPDPELELASFKLPPGFQATLFAGEPLIANPICMNWDTRGRLWVATSRIYPQLKPGERANDQIVVLEDTNGDGQADVRTVFADGLLVPTSVLPGDGGVYVANSTELLHLSDTDGDGRADQTRVVLSGFGTEDTHQILHAFRRGPSGKLYFNQSVLIHSHVETPRGVRRLAAGGVWEFDPDDQTLEVYARGMVNPWGNQFDRWGQSFATDGAYGEGINYIWPGSAFYWADGVPRILRGLNPGQPKECGLEIISGRHFPPDWQGRFVTADFRAHRIVTFELSESGSGYFSEQKEDLIQSEHEAFRPVDLKMGPDGALYVCDWYNPIINHGEVDFRDPRRDHQHGRIWRIAATERALLANPRLDEADLPALFDALKAPEQWTRDMARQELTSRQQPVVARGLSAWTDQLDPSDPEFEHHRLEALWASEMIGVVPAPLLKELLHSADHRVRAAAVRVLSHRRDSITDSLALLEEAVADDHPRVRLEAVNALRQVGTLSAFETALRALDHPIDEQIDFALWVTVRELETIWSPAFSSGQISFGGDPGRVAFVLAASEQKSLLRPLIDRFNRGELDVAFHNQVTSLIAAAGDQADLRLLFDQAIRNSNAVPRSVLLEHLLSAAVERGLTPTGDLSELTKFLAEEPTAIALAGHWKLASARSTLVEIAGDRSRPDSIRESAIRAVAQLGGEQSKQTLVNLTAAEQRNAIRAAAVAALTFLDLPYAAQVAVEVLPQLRPVEAGVVFDAFLQQTSGAQTLGDRIAQAKLRADVAAVGIGRAALFGSRGTALVDALKVAGGATTSRASLSPAEWHQLLADVVRRGDPKSGERVFRKESLGCVKCHSVGGAGGRVGPDLMSLGASAPLDYIAESLVHPNRKIKEGYDTSLVILDDGQILTGMVIGEVGDQFLLRNADNIVVKVPNESVDEKINQSVSLMPPGLTDVLSDRDFLDLVRFLAEIGKSEPFRVPAIETVRVWQTLASANSLTEAAMLSKSPSESVWLPAVSEVNGRLPFAELQPVDVDGVGSYVTRFQLEVHQPGRIGWQVDAGNQFRVWVDGAACPTTGSLVKAELPAGTHSVTISVPAATAPPHIRVTRQAQPGSMAQALFKLEI